MITAKDGEDAKRFTDIRNQLRVLVDAMDDRAICSLDENGLIISWNTGAQRVDGYTEDEILNQHFSIFFTAEDRIQNIPAQALATASATGEYAGEGWRVRKGGRQYWAKVLIRSVRADDGALRGFIRIVKDFDEQRKLEFALRESEQRFRLFTESIADYALYILDPTGIVTSWNTGAERIKGYRAEEIIGCHFSVFYTPEDQETGAPERALAIAAETGKFAAETIRLRKDGSRFAADVVIHPIRSPEGTILGFAKITRDVTEKRQAEKALADSEHEKAILEERQHGFDLLQQTSRTLAKIVEASPFAIMTADGDNKIEIWNSAAERIYGIPADTAIGSDWAQLDLLVPEVDGKNNGQQLLALARQDGRTAAMEIRRRRPDGTIVELSRSAALIPEDYGKPGIVVISEDVTERKVTENLLRQAQRMEAIGQLTGGVAHDFNNLLAILLGNLELIAERTRTDALLEELTNDALKAAKRGATLTHRLLAFSRQQPLTPIIVRIHDRARDMISLLRRVLGEAIEISATIPPALWPTRIDISQLENALINLAVNARDAMPNGGQLIFGAENTTLDEAYAQQAQIETGDYVVLTISDTGTGMSKEVLSRAMEPFFTTKPVGKGTGLGLSMVYGFVKQSGGHLTIYSEPGQGTTVRLYLPRADAPATTAAPGASLDDALLERNSRVILIVEDDDAVRKIQSNILVSLGYRTIEASTAVSALKLLETDQRIDLLLTDIVLPGGLTGTNLAEKTRALRPELPIIFMSGYAPQGQLPDATNPQNTLLSKPFSRATLARTVAETLSGKKRHDA